MIWLCKHCATPYQCCPPVSYGDTHGLNPLFTQNDHSFKHFVDHSHFYQNILNYTPWHKLVHSETWQVAWFRHHSSRIGEFSVAWERKVEMKMVVWNGYDWIWYGIVILWWGLWGDLMDKGGGRWVLAFWWCHPKMCFCGSQWSREG